MFNVAIQSGAIVAAVVVFWPRLMQLLQRLDSRDNRDYLSKLFVAFAITAIGGFIAKKLGLELPKAVAPVAWALIVGGALILIIEWLVAKRPVVTELT